MAIFLSPFFAMPSSSASMPVSVFSTKAWSAWRRRLIAAPLFANFTRSFVACEVNDASASSPEDARNKAPPAAEITTRQGSHSFVFMPLLSFLDRHVLKWIRTLLPGGAGICGMG